MKKQDQDRRHSDKRVTGERRPQADEPDLPQRRGDDAQRGVSGEEARRQGLPQTGERGPGPQEE